MGLLDDYSSGVGSPRPKWAHQRVMSRLMRNMYSELHEQGFDPLPEATVTDDWDDLAPDVVIFDAQNRPLSIIEITTHKECKAIIRKCYELIARFPDAEYFVYDYEKGLFYAYDAEADEWYSSAEDEIRSRYLSRPLQAYLV